MAASASSALSPCAHRFSYKVEVSRNEATQLRASSTFYGPGLCHRQSRTTSRSRRKSHAVSVRAAKLPQGVDLPKEEPKLQVSFWGFTEKAEAWNSRAAMIGIFALIALEFVVHKGILQLIGVEVGKGLNLPL